MIVIKRDAFGREVTRYRAEAVLHRAHDEICLRARFQRPEARVGSLTMAPGDVFTEWFSARCWYNVFRVEDGRSARLKGWYCNFTRPAELGESWLAADDLALDLVVTPQRALQLLDLEEYLALRLARAERRAVATAYQQLIQRILARDCPFDFRSDMPEAG